VDRVVFTGDSAGSLQSSKELHSAWLTLAMASTLAGNLTVTGSVANIIVVERVRKEATITFLDYFRIGLPITLLTLLFGWLWLSWIR
jgi:Na+/H+ antiporter NhaD/arsenite permease-like protein